MKTVEGTKNIHCVRSTGIEDFFMDTCPHSCFWQIRQMDIPANLTSMLENKNNAQTVFRMMLSRIDNASLTVANILTNVNI